MGIRIYKHLPSLWKGKGAVESSVRGASMIGEQSLMVQCELPACLSGCVSRLDYARRCREKTSLKERSHLVRSQISPVKITLDLAKNALWVGNSRFKRTEFLAFPGLIAVTGTRVMPSTEQPTKQDGLSTLCRLVAFASPGLGRKGGGE